jgi:Bifunctional DNA primase/polymerase, N-terminal
MAIPAGTPESAADAAWRKFNQDKINRVRERAEEMADYAALAPPEPPEVQAVNRIIAEGRWLADHNPLFAAARSASTHYSIVPLEAGGTTPVLPAQEATRDLRRLLEWWQTYPSANVGIVSGCISNIIAVRVGGKAGLETLRQLATVRYHDPDNDCTYEEVRELPAAVVSIGKPGQPVVATNSRSLGWGRQGQARKAREIMDAQRPELQVQYYLMAYPPEQSGQDNRDYKARNLGDGVAILGEGEVIPFSGRLLSGAVIQAPCLPPPEVPSWFATKYGKERK